LKVGVPPGAYSHDRRRAPVPGVAPANFFVLRTREPAVATTSSSVSRKRAAEASGGLSPSCAVVYIGARPIVELSGRADRVTINQVSGVIRGLRAVGIRHLVIDVSRVLACDRRLLTVLARAHAQLADDTGALTITGVKLPQFLTALQAAGLDEVFVIYDAVRRETLPAVGAA
jgi:anti-anti-sigma regulatory factor